MLLKLLEEIRKSNTIEPAQLAAKMGTSIEMVKVMLEHLTRSGILKDNSLACKPTQCSNCPIYSDCNPNTSSLKIWGYSQKQ